MAVTRQPSTHLSNYNFGREYIGMLNEDAALRSAHPDDTALFVGPPRLSMINTAVLNSEEPIFKLFGAFQAVNFAMTQQVVPAKAIGSSRYFFFTSNAPVSIGFSMLFMKPANLLKTIYTNLRAIIGDSALNDAFGKYAFINADDNVWMNLDSELFSVPFGLGVLWSNKERSFIGAAYFENTMVVSFSTQITTGAQVLTESGSFTADRMMPFDLRAAFESDIPAAQQFDGFRESVYKYFGFDRETE